MAYSTNIKNLIISLCKSRSPEEVASLLEKKVADEKHGKEFISELANSMQIFINNADWEDLNNRIPTPKTIRTWIPFIYSQEIMPVVNQFDKEKHHNELMNPFISQLRDISIFPPRHFDIAIFWSRPNEPHWPTAGGQIERQTGGRLEVRLFIEEKLEFVYLRQHLTGDPVWNAIQEWKQIEAKDLKARFTLLDKITAETQARIGLSVLSELGKSNSDKDGLGLYYIYTIYDQVFSQVAGIPLAKKRKEDFTFEPPNITSLNSYLLIRSHDSSLHTRAINYLLESQVSMSKLPDAKVSKKAYEEALSKTATVKRHVERIRLTAAFPEGSTCEGCRPRLNAGVDKDIL